MKSEKVAVYIDGGNTYRALKTINAFDGIKKFSYLDFVNFKECSSTRTFSDADIVEFKIDKKR